MLRKISHMDKHLLNKIKVILDDASSIGIGPIFSYISPSTHHSFDILQIFNLLIMKTSKPLLLTPYSFISALCLVNYIVCLGSSLLSGLPWHSQNQSLQSPKTSYNPILLTKQQSNRFILI